MMYFSNHDEFFQTVETYLNNECGDIEVSSLMTLLLLRDANARLNHLIVSYEASEDEIRCLYEFIQKNNLQKKFSKWVQEGNFK